MVQDSLQDMSLVKEKGISNLTELTGTSPIAKMPRPTEIDTVTD